MISSEKIVTLDDKISQLALERGVSFDDILKAILRIVNQKDIDNLRETKCLSDGQAQIYTQRFESKLNQLTVSDIVTALSLNMPIKLKERHGNNSLTKDDTTK